MKKYLIYFKVGFLDLLAYRADFIIYIVFNMVFFFVFLALWKNIYTGTGITEINNYSLNNTITYYFITSLIFRLDPTFSMYLNYTVWNGSFTNDLIKPWSALAVDLIYTLSELLLKLLLYLPFCFFIYIVSSQYINLPGFNNLIYFLITIFLGIFLAYYFYQMIHALCFHFGDQENNIGLVSFVVAFLAGGTFPLAFLPDKIRAIFEVLPFRFLFDVPANIFLEKLSEAQILLNWLQMILWTILFATIFYFIYRTGLKKYTGTGR